MHGRPLMVDMSRVI